MSTGWNDPHLTNSAYGAVSKGSVDSMGGSIFNSLTMALANQYTNNAYTQASNLLSTDNQAEGINDKIKSSIGSIDNAYLLTGNQNLLSLKNELLTKQRLISSSADPSVDQYGNTAVESSDMEAVKNQSYDVLNVQLDKKNTYDKLYNVTHAHDMLSNMLQGVAKGFDKKELDNIAEKEKANIINLNKQYEEKYNALDNSIAKLQETKNLSFDSIRDEIVRDAKESRLKEDEVEEVERTLNRIALNNSLKDKIKIGNILLKSNASAKTKAQLNSISQDIVKLMSDGRITVENFNEAKKLELNIKYRVSR